MHRCPVTFHPELLARFAGHVTDAPSDVVLLGVSVEESRAEQQAAWARGEPWQFWVTRAEFERRRASLYPPTSPRALGEGPNTVIRSSPFAAHG